MIGFYCLLFILGPFKLSKIYIFYTVQYLYVHAHQTMII